MDYLKYLTRKKVPNSTPLPECSPDEVMVERRTEFPFGRTFTPIVHEIHHPIHHTEQPIHHTEQPIHHPEPEE